MAKPETNQPDTLGDAPRTRAARRYGWLDGRVPAAGDEVWIKATVTDPCTSCCGVRIVGLSDKTASLYVTPDNVRLATADGPTANPEGDRT